MADEEKGSKGDADASDLKKNGRSRNGLEKRKGNFLQTKSHPTGSEHSNPRQGLDNSDPSSKQDHAYDGDTPADHNGDEAQISNGRLQHEAPYKNDGKQHETK